MSGVKRDAGDHKGPHPTSSSTPAPTESPEPDSCLRLAKFFRTLASLLLYDAINIQYHSVRVSLSGASFMKAVIITRPGGPEVLEIQDVETPQPVGEQVRVRVRASGINRAELLQRMGAYPAPAGSPQNIPGMEF